MNKYGQVFVVLSGNLNKHALLTMKQSFATNCLFLMNEISGCVESSSLTKNYLVEHGLSEDQEITHTVSDIMNDSLHRT